MQVSGFRFQVSEKKKCRFAFPLYRVPGTYNLRASRGISLVEMLIYTGILVLTVATVGSATLALSRVHRSIVAEQRVEQAGSSALERMLREARDAISIDVAQSAFATTTGKLTLNTTDSDNAEMQLGFLLATTTSSIQLYKNGIDVGPLTSTTTRVTRLVFTSITTPESDAIKVEMTVESGTSTHFRSKSFYGTAILRGSYDIE